MELSTHASACGQFTGHCETSVRLSLTLPYLSEGRGPGDTRKIQIYSLLPPPPLLNSPSPFNTHQPPRNAKLRFTSEDLPVSFLDQDGPEDMLEGCLLPLMGRLHERVQGH